MAGSLEGNNSLFTIGYYDEKGAYAFSGNLSDPQFANQVARECPTVDVLIFLVGLAHKKGNGAEYNLFEKTNYQTLVNLLEALKSQNKLPSKIIFASTISVYGERYNENGYIESLVPNPYSPYAVTKLQAEQYLLEKWKDKSWILRFAPVYSPKFLLNINRRTKMGKMFYKIGKGEKKLSLCNIENIIATVEGIIDGEVPPEIYNISDPISYTYNDLLNHQGATFVFRIPALAIRMLYVVGEMSKNIFLKENSVKLITDNIFPSDKLRAYVNLPATLNDIKFGND